MEALQFVSRVVSGLWSFLVGILRVLLFIVCILTFLYQLATLFVTFRLLDYLGFIASEYTEDAWFFYLIIGSLATLFLVGAHGAYSNKAKYLNWVSYMMFAIILSIYSLIVFMLVTRPVISNYNTTLILKSKFKIEQSAQKYQFDLDHSSSPNEATKAWDRVQGDSQCCGFESYKDWSFWRAEMVTSGRLPGSCCVPFPSNVTCTTGSSHFNREGCGGGLGLLSSMLKMELVVFPFWCLFLSAIAMVVSRRAKNQMTIATPGMQLDDLYKKCNSAVVIQEA